MKKTILIMMSILLVISVIIISFNYFGLSKPLSEIIKIDSRNAGIEMRAHYGKYVMPSILVLDIRNISGEISPADVFRLLLQYANKLKEKKFDTIELASKGRKKFVLKGDYFKQLGVEYGDQNPVYTTRTFPENVYKPNGEKAFESWEGGILGILKEQMNDFNEFHKQWYIEDMIK